MKTGSQMKNTREEPNVTAGAICAECGMSTKDWPDPKGVSREGETYCCDGCAEGTGCTCEDETA